MSHAQRNKQPGCPTWAPSASLSLLRKRANMLAAIRQFFAERNIMEVETPLLCHTSATDPFIQSIPAFIKTASDQKTYYLQTSPEYAMKRLLAAGSGPIYQITKAFRQDEIGTLHNPEFTLLEWYRPQFDHHDLMNDVEDLLQTLLNTPRADRISYQTLFEDHLNINPHLASSQELRACAKANHIAIASPIDDRDTWLDLLLTHLIEPALPKERPCFIYDYPASQAALARIVATNPPVAARFEVYINGIELANGFHELKETNEQRQRFENNLLKRKQAGLDLLPIDEYFLAALDHGLPDCAGVALGLDRLLMIATHTNSLADVLSFDFSRA